MEELKTIEILEADKEDYENEIKRTISFIEVTKNSNLSNDIKSRVLKDLNDELSTLQFYEDEIKRDLISISIGELTAEQEDYMIESQLEEIRERRENEY